MIRKGILGIFIALFATVINANAARLITNFEDLQNSISQGDSIRAITFINKCSMEKTISNQDVIAGMNFTTFNKYQVTIGAQQKNTIATSTNTLIEHAALGTVYNYVRLRVFDDNTAEIFSEYLNPATYKQLGSMTVNCLISNGHDKNGILLYDVS